ncbi:MAG: 4-alpha-glucanotransferase [Chloroflexi bacterium]|nr:4-alpha-glucanotransferase [Chloroflexota bacterium]
MMERASGVLLHPTSLPGGHGIGDLGPEAYRFVDFLAAAGQRLWQIMPLGPPGYGESPYAARSAFAGNPLLISLDRLVEDGLLTSDEAVLVGDHDGDRAHFARVEAFKLARLRQAWERFDTEGGDRRHDLDRFGEEQRSWLPDYVLFMALRDQHSGAWTDWSPEFVARDAGALKEASKDLAGEVAFQTFLQFLFFEQWRDLRDYANARGVRIVGDVPIFVAHDSSDVWAHQDVFYLDEHGRPTLIAGVPPDAFSSTGQRWGNPLYRWDVLGDRGFDWWVERFRATFALVDIVRIDHFRGFQACWHIPAREPTAENGDWVETPGRELFDAVRAELGDAPVIAEDLGLITPEVHALREDLGIPGMNVLQFAFGGESDNLYLPHNHTRDSVVYTGTHDNDTTVGWYASLDERTRDHVRRYLGVDGSDIAWDLIRAALQSVAEMAIVPVQDLLALDGEARMNFPGRPEGNWSWRLLPGQLTDAHAARLRDLAELYGRTALTNEAPS